MNIIKDRIFILFNIVVIGFISVISYGFAYSHDDYIKYFCLKLLWITKTSENETLLIVMYLPLLVYGYGFYKAYKEKSNIITYILLVFLLHTLWPLLCNICWYFVAKNIIKG